MEKELPKDAKLRRLRNPILATDEWKRRGFRKMKLLNPFTLEKHAMPFPQKSPYENSRLRCVSGAAWQLYLTERFFLVGIEGRTRQGRSAKRGGSLVCSAPSRRRV